MRFFPPSDPQCRSMQEHSSGKLSDINGLHSKEHNAWIVSRKLVRGPGAEPQRCEECSKFTAHGKEGDGQQFFKKWFCMDCWDSWERGHNETAKDTFPRDDAPADCDAWPPRSLLLQMWFAREDALLVSLGTWCGVKKGIQGINVGSPSLPFDWIRVSIQGVIRLIRNGFDGFFDYYYITQDRHFLAESHSFFHDDLMLPQTVAKYKRRIDRFWKLRERGCQSRPLPTVFVYAINSTVELLFVENLRTLLQDLFGKSASLLVILDGQPESQTLLFHNSPGLLLCTIGTAFARKEEYDIIDPPYVRAYHGPLRTALSYVNDGVHPSPSIDLDSVTTLVQDALNNQASCPLKHICLGEDLSTSMAYEPHLPCDETFRFAQTPRFEAMKEIVWAQCQAHYCYIGGMNLVEGAEDRIDEHLPVRRWRVGFAASIFKDQILDSVAISTQAQQSMLASRTDVPWEVVD